MSEMPELKPCPFCGGEAEYHSHDASIYCNDCAGGVTDWTIIKEDLFEQWNNRDESHVQELLRQQRVACWDNFLSKTAIKLPNGAFDQIREAILSAKMQEHEDE